MFNLTGKSALVTGASGGIGSAIARALHAAGAQVALSGTRVAALENVAATLGDRVAIVPCNLGDVEARGKLIATATEQVGNIDILVNNAGLTRDNLAMRLKDEDWDTVLSINLSAAFQLSRAALRGMMKARWGRIVNITSVVGVTGNPGQVNYAAAKAGMVGMSKSMAQEVASRGITINCVAPGFIATAMTEELNDQQQESILQNIPAGKMGAPEDIATGVLYLASDEGGYVTGQTLHINGGMAMI